MRILEIAPPWFPVPALGYGGIEQVVSTLTDGLVDRGQKVTLVASGGSDTRADLVSPLATPPAPALLGDVSTEVRLAVAKDQRQGVPREARLPSPRGDPPERGFRPGGTAARPNPTREAGTRHRRTRCEGS